MEVVIGVLVFAIALFAVITLLRSVPACSCLSAMKHDHNACGQQSPEGRAGAQPRVPVRTRVRCGSASYFRSGLIFIAMNLDLDDAEQAALIRLLRGEVENTRYPLSRFSGRCAAS